jgi:hypothetical protein
VEIHYSFIGDNENPQKSEKDITIVCADATVTGKLIGQFNSITGITQIPALA